MEGIKAKAVEQYNNRVTYPWKYPKQTHSRTVKKKKSWLSLGKHTRKTVWNGRLVLRN